MSRRFWMILLILVVATPATAPAQGRAPEQGQMPDPGPEVVIHLADGTVLPGRIADETATTIVLEQWHLVLQNEEAKPAPEARPVTRMAYID